MAKFFTTQTFTVTVFTFFFAFPAIAASPNDILINEIAWMGSMPDAGESVSQAANDEWIEFYNPNESLTPLDGWTIASKDGKPEIALRGNIGPKSYFLLSRANQIVAGAIADLVYPYKDNALSNDGEYLQLLDAEGNIIDQLNASSTGWPAGDNSTKQTMERENPTGTVPVAWITSLAAGGTPKAQNSVYKPVQNNQTAPTSSPTPTQIKTPTLTPESTPSPTPESTPTPTPNPQTDKSTPTIEPTASPAPAYPVDMPLSSADTPAETPSPTPSPVATAQKSAKSAIKDLEKIVKKYDSAGENKNKQLTVSSTASVDNAIGIASEEKISFKQTASIGESADWPASPAGGSAKNKNLSIYLLAPLIALFSAGLILTLKKRMRE